MKFIDGVTLIKEIPLNNPYIWIGAVIISFLILCLAFFIAKKIEYDYTSELLGRYMGVLCIWFICNVLFFTYAGRVAIFHTGQSNYEVIVSGDVNMKEFEEEYKIIDYKDGKYIIQIRN